MNNGYQKFNGCGADKEGGEIFNTFFYPELQPKHVRPLATNVFGLGEGGLVGCSNLAGCVCPLLPNPCYKLAGLFSTKAKSKH